MKDIRQLMIEDMKLRGLTPGTQATYLEAGVHLRMIQSLLGHKSLSSTFIHKVRYYGLWSPSKRKKLLKMQQTLTQSGNDQPERLEEDMDAEVSPSSEPRQCPHCQKGALVCIRRLPRQGRAPP